MPTNRTSNDIDFVPPTQYSIPPTRKAKEASPQPGRCPTFEPLHIANFDDHGTPNLPPDPNINDPLAIFKLFFIDEIMDKLAKWTNEYAELYPAEETQSARKWKPTDRQQLYAYFGVLIHIGITIESSIEDYWSDLESAGAEHVVKNYIGLVRFQQLDRYFRCTAPWPKEDSTPRTTFDRVNGLSKHLRLSCRKFYPPGTHLAVNETIQRFMGRASEILNIPLKPTPEGSEIWALTNEGYILDWLWHAKGDNKGPVDLDTTFTKEEGFSKTQAVVLDLLTQRDPTTDLPLYPPPRAPRCLAR